MGTDESVARPWVIDADVMGALRLGAAQAAVDAGDWDRALVECEELLDQSPRNIDALRLIGRIAQSQGDATLAVEAWGHVVELRPGEVDAIVSLAQSRFELVDFEGALAAATDATRLNPAHADAWFALAQARERLGQTEEALAAYQRAWTLDPSHYKVPVPITEWVWQAAYLAAVEAMSPVFRDHLRKAQVEWSEFPSLDQLQSEQPPINPFTEVILHQPSADEADGALRVQLFRGNLGRPFADNKRLATRIAAALEAEARSWDLWDEAIEA